MLTEVRFIYTKRGLKYAVMEFKRLKRFHAGGND
jgi:hypothetical protein